MKPVGVPELQGCPKQSISNTGRLLAPSDRIPMSTPLRTITDGRSNKVAILCHCIMNTNAKAVNLPTTKLYPFMVTKIIDCLARNSTSIVQMPCPEQLFFGFSRRAGTMDRDSMDTHEFRRHCSSIAENVATIVSEYIRNGFSVKCIVGSRGSPSCGVTKTHTSKGIESKPGILMEDVRKELEGKGIQLKFMDIDLERADAIDRGIEELERLVE